MEEYLKNLKRILVDGEDRDDRTGTGTKSLFGIRMEFDLRRGFPAVTTKKLAFGAVKKELLWFLKGSTNIKWLNDNGVHIWDEWADEDGFLGPVYGKQWRRWSGPGCDWTDQIKKVVESIKENPSSRRHVVSAWNVSQLREMNLPPCHVLFQFYVHNNKSLSCQLYQRSGDMFLGVPFNIASYALLTHMVAQVTGLSVNKFVHIIGDAHVYNNHQDQAAKQLKREQFKLPRLYLNKDIDDIDMFKPEDIRLENYEHHGKLIAPISV